MHELFYSYSCCAPLFVKLIKFNPPLLPPKCTNCTVESEFRSTLLRYIALNQHNTNTYCSTLGY